MLNVEKYKEEILAIKNKYKGNDNFFAMTKDNKIVECDDIECKDCIFYYDFNLVSCTNKIVDWLLSEYKEKPLQLTKDEYEFLRLLGSGYLARSKRDWLYFYDDEPTENECWEGDYEDYGDYSFNVNRCFDSLTDSFKFIKSINKKPYSVEELLENSVVAKEAQE